VTVDGRRAVEREARRVFFLSKRIVFFFEGDTYVHEMRGAENSYSVEQAVQPINSAHWKQTTASTVYCGRVKLIVSMT
jgi:hypothetical protein